MNKDINSSNNSKRQYGTLTTNFESSKIAKYLKSNKVLEKSRLDSKSKSKRDEKYNFSNVKYPHTNKSVNSGIFNFLK